MKLLCIAAIFCLAGLVTGTEPKSANSGVTASFIQLNRDATGRTTADWQALFSRMTNLNIRSSIVQWCEEGDVCYFATHDLPCTEQYDTLERIFEAAGACGMSIQLGLANDPAYWTQLTARDKVLRDYFLIRVSRNEKLQKALLKKFGDNPLWTGYYICEEIDDLTWRRPERRDLLKSYIDLMSRRLRAHDSKRSIGMSSFFRGRTAPDVYANILLDIAAGNTLTELLIQDGMGVGDPPADYIPIYLRSVAEAWETVTNKPMPKLLGVIEAFRQTSAQDQPFKAVPAPSADFEKQIKAVQPFFDHLVLFTYPDYVDSHSGGAAAELAEKLKNIK